LVASQHVIFFFFGPALHANAFTIFFDFFPLLSFCCGHTHIELEKYNIKNSDVESKQYKEQTKHPTQHIDFQTMLFHLFTHKCLGGVWKSEAEAEAESRLALVNKFGNLHNFFSLFVFDCSFDLSVRYRSIIPLLHQNRVGTHFLHVIIYWMWMQNVQQHEYKHVIVDTKQEKNIEMEQEIDQKYQKRSQSKPTHTATNIDFSFFFLCSIYFFAKPTLLKIR
jgi:hypothetical protein